MLPQGAIREKTFHMIYSIFGFDVQESPA